MSATRAVRSAAGGGPARCVSYLTYLELQPASFMFALMFIVL